MASKKNGISVVSSTLTLGLDIGYGVVKAVTDNQVITFPSVAGYARDLKFQSVEITDKYPGEHIIDDYGDWFLGDLALSQIPAGELLRLRGRTANEDERGNQFRVRLAKVAFSKLFPHVRNRDVVHVRVATGLPVDHMRDKDALKAALIGQHLIKTDEREFIVNITEVMVMPQPYGTIYNRMLTSDGKINAGHTAKTTGVVDVGTYTVDVAVDDDGEYIDSQSGSVESGVFTAQERISALLEREYRQKMSFKAIEETLRTGYFRARGEIVDYRADVNEALAPLRSATMGLLSERFGAGVALDVIYVSGGGAELVYRDIVSAYEQAKLVKDSQIANASGYLRYAHADES